MFLIYREWQFTFCKRANNNRYEKYNFVVVFSTQSSSVNYLFLRFSHRNRQFIYSSAEDSQEYLSRYSGVAILTSNRLWAQHASTARNRCPGFTDTKNLKFLTKRPSLIRRRGSPTWKEEKRIRKQCLETLPGKQDSKRKQQHWRARRFKRSGNFRFRIPQQPIKKDV